MGLQLSATAFLAAATWSCLALDSAGCAVAILLRQHLLSPGPKMEAMIYLFKQPSWLPSW